MKEKMKNIVKKTAVPVIALLLGLLIALLSNNNASATSFEEIEVVEDTPIVEEIEEVEEVVEEVVEEQVQQPVQKPQTYSAPVVQTAPVVETPVVEEKEEVVVVTTIETSKKLPTIVGRTVESSDFGTITVKRGTEDITSTCTISINDTKVNYLVSGKGDVVINATCTGTSASLTAEINVYVPAKEEAPKASSNTDTSIAETAPKTEVVTDKNGEQTRDTRTAVEMTKVTIVSSVDGSQTTYVKDVIENTYATQTNRVIYDFELPSNYKVEGNTLTVNGKTFTAK